MPILFMLLQLFIYVVASLIVWQKSFLPLSSSPSSPPSGPSAPPSGPSASSTPSSPAAAQRPKSGPCWHLMKKKISQTLYDCSKIKNLFCLNDFLIKLLANWCRKGHLSAFLQKSWICITYSRRKWFLFFP